MINNNTPCYGCTERHDLCHSECDKYLAFKEKNENMRSEQRERLDINYTLSRLHYHRAASRKQSRKPPKKVRGFYNG